MSTSFSEFAETVERLHGAVLQLERASKLLQLEPLRRREWFELLEQKLLPQLRDDAYLVVAVVGGTNIGKSVVFNHIAGNRASSTSPLASGTKHPVCLMPPGFAEKHDMALLFPGFELHAWSRSEAALEEHDEHRLFWKTSEQMPDNLLVLDTPDIDSDAEVNWHRADIVRRSADVLIAVLTQQKYNDAAVKQFFRKAAEEDKAVIVVFNQCELPDDDAYWPLWLKTFCGETGIKPEYVYIAPNDRKAAEGNRLPFFERSYSDVSEAPTDDVLSSKQQTVESAATRSLRDDLSRLHFREIKLRTLQGSLQLLANSNLGVDAYLSEVKTRGTEFLSAAERLSSEGVVKIRDWPSVSNKLLVAEVRCWWKEKQEGWSMRVNKFYDTVGAGVSWPFRFARDKLQGEPEPPLETYRKAEWNCVLRTVEELFEKLNWMRESGSALLQPQFERLLAGRAREDLLEQLRVSHQQVDLETELKEIVNAEMQTFQQESPDLYKFYRQINNVSAAVRPVTSVVMFTMGWGPAGEVVAPFVANAAAHAVVPIVADFAGGTAVALAGESAISGAASQGAGMLQAKFQELHTAFIARRAGWLMNVLKSDLLGTLPDEFQAAAGVPSSDEFQTVASSLERLKQQLETTNTPGERLM